VEFRLLANKIITEIKYKTTTDTLTYNLLTYLLLSTPHSKEIGERLMTDIEAFDAQREEVVNILKYGLKGQDTDSDRRKKKLKQTSEEKAKLLETLFADRKFSNLSEILETMDKGLRNLQEQTDKVTEARQKVLGT